jgi:hypothetical protein
MDNRTISTKRASLSSLTCSAVVFFLVLTSLHADSLAQDTKSEAQNKSSFPATQVLGLPDTHANASGSLAVQGGSLRFESGKQGVRLIPIVSIQSVLLSQTDKEIGGMPMTLGKAATPFGGGRVVSLFAHKKYDYVSLVYRDENGGIHGVIFELPAGQGTQLREALASSGAHIAPQENPLKQDGDSVVSDGSVPGVAADQESGSAAGADGKWSLQVEEVNSGDIKLDPAFRVAIYENLIDALEKTERFEHIYRSGDRQAETRNDLLTLRINAREFAAGSETTRAVTTVGGATKIKVQCLLQTKEGQRLADQLVDATVRFFGNNLKATHTLAHKVGAIVANSKLPEPAKPVVQADRGN